MCEYKETWQIHDCNQDVLYYYYTCVTWIMKCLHQTLNCILNIKQWLHITWLQIKIYSNGNQLYAQNQTSNLFQFKIKLSLLMCVLFYLSFVCISAYANVYFKPTIIKQNIKIILLQNNIHMSRSIAGVPFDSVGRFQATLLLRTTCMCLCCNGVASCVVAWQTKNQKPKPLVSLSSFLFHPTLHSQRHS